MSSRSGASAAERANSRDTELDARVAALVGDDLAAVETRVRRELHSAVPLIQETIEYLAGVGARRLRPVLILLTARLAGYRGPRATLLASVVELLHTATLIHDDLVDAAPGRGGQPSANVRWGADASVLIGDYVYAKSFALLIADGDPAIIRLLVRSTVSMTEAAGLRLQRRRRGLLSESDYLDIVTRKTAWFMSACCRIGARLGGLPRTQVEALARYGLSVGIASRMAEDARYVSAVDLGQLAEVNHRQWIDMLPVIVALERAPAAHTERLRLAMRSRTPTAADVAEVRRLVREHEGVQHARMRAEAFAHAAKQHLQEVAPSREREALSFLADFIGAPPPSSVRRRLP